MLNKRNDEINKMAGLNGQTKLKRRFLRNKFILLFVLCLVISDPLATTNKSLELIN